MPYPISPAGQINSYDNLFSSHDQNEVSTANRHFQRDGKNDSVIALLEAIDKHQDDVVNAAAEYLSSKAEKYYNVPPSISEESLLMLKTSGYLSGHGRTVRFSEQAKNLLKKHYLGTENSFKSQRIKKKIV